MTSGRWIKIKFSPILLMEFVKRPFIFPRVLTKIPGIILGIFAFSLVLLTNLTSSSSGLLKRELIAPPVIISHLSFGYKETLGDVLWIRAIQDFDFCDKPLGQNLCINNTWLFKMLDAITELSPNFRIPYAAGGLALTVLVSDYDGATKIFDKGVKAFPHDWPILYRAAYHYLYEVKDKKRAAELLIQAGQNGAPPWVFTLAGRLYSDSGELDLAQNLLQEMKDTNQDATLIQRLQDKIDSMKAAKATGKSQEKSAVNSTK